MFDKIVFFHNHVNGDCYLNRILVKQIIDATKDNNIIYYYTAQRAHASRCLDLGIPDENFNVINVPDINAVYNIQNNILFINVWVGLIPYVWAGTYEDKNIICGLCIKNLIPKNNMLIDLLNKDLNINIKLLNSNMSEQLPIDYNYYNGDFMNVFISENKQKYEKIVLICNNNPTTFITTVNLTKIYLLYITEKFPNYLFITFETESLQKINLTSIKKIYNQTNTPITNNWAIMFPLLSKLCDKVILLPTGPSMMCFNNDEAKNKFMMFFDFSNSGNPGNCPHCNNNREYLCTSRFGWEIKLFNVDYTDKDINNKICYFVEEFLQL